MQFKINDKVKLNQKNIDTYFDQFSKGIFVLWYKENKNNIFKIKDILTLFCKKAYDFSRGSMSIMVIILNILIKMMKYYFFSKMKN